MRNKFRVGDRISRPLNIYQENSDLRFGTICARLAIPKGDGKLYPMSSRYGPYPETYSVVWDDRPNEIHNGFLSHGLTLVEEREYDNR
jgi:hypothetical protein